MTALGWGLIGACAAATAISNFLLRFGIGHAGEVALSWASAVQLLRQPSFVLGVMLYGCAALIWFRIVATEKLSTAYPILVSATFVLVTVGAVFLLDERVTLSKLAGLGLIIAGVLLVSQSQ